MIDLRLLVLSDIHSDSSVIHKIYEEASEEEITALIICGDLTHFGSLTQAGEILKGLTELGLSVLFIPGNCDPKELATIQSVYSAINIHGRYREMEDLGFLGIGGSPFTPFRTSFEMSENKMKKILDETYINSNNGKKKLILISHSPPINTKVDLTSSGIHAGSRAVREFVETEKPFLVLCGHIHEAKGIDMIGSTLIVNPGSANRGLWATIKIMEDIKVRLGAL